MSDPRTQLGVRRLRILRMLSGAISPLTVESMSSRLGLTARTVRDHLHFLHGLGCVARFNYRRWCLAHGFTLKGFDCSKLDGEPDATS